MKLPRWIIRLANRLADPPTVCVDATAFGLSEANPDNTAAIQEAIGFAGLVQKYTSIKYVAVMFPAGEFRLMGPVDNQSVPLMGQPPPSL